MKEIFGSNYEQADTSNNLVGAISFGLLNHFDDHKNRFTQTIRKKHVKARQMEY